MSNLSRCLFLIAAVVAAVCSGNGRAESGVPSYPATPRGDVVDTYYGTRVPDPYRWLEDVGSPQTVAWAKAENAVAHEYLNAIPERARIKTAFRALSNYVKQRIPFRAGRHWFYFRQDGSQDQAVLYIRDSEFGAGRAFIDPNSFSKDGSVQLARTSFSFDGTLVAYATQTGGSDWLTWHVRSVADGSDRPDIVRWSKASFPTWVGDDGFYYRAYDPPTESDATLAALGPLKLRFHRLGMPQADDRVVYEPRGPELPGIRMMDDQRLMLFQLTSSNGSSLAWKYRDQPDSEFRPVFNLTRNVHYQVVGNDGTRTYLKTNAGAPMDRLVWTELTDPAHALHDLVPEGRDKMGQAVLVGERFYVEWEHDAHSVLAMYDLNGRYLGRIRLPGLGTAKFAPGLRDDPAVYYGFESWAYPPRNFRYDPKTAQSTVLSAEKVAFDPAEFVAEQIFATSRDGTRIPVFVVHRKGMRLEGTAPTILEGYGGFNIPSIPYFAPAIALWLQMGGVYAVANVRGGGEYGETWHAAGMLGNKQHTFDDFAAAAQLLIARKFTASRRLAARGGSNGGLLVAATVEQHPTLFGAVVAEEGVYDMLRYHRFTIGRFWIDEYGSADASEEAFRTLYAYSPVHNAREGTVYPATLIAAAANDDRVHPLHSFKLAAALQHAQAGPAPILLRVEQGEGHFAGLTRAGEIDLNADIFAFLSKSLGFHPFARSSGT